MENPNNSSSSNVRIFPGCEEEYAGKPFVSGNLFTGDDLLFVTCAALGRQVSEALAKPSHIYAGSSDEGHGWLWGSSVVKRADHWTDTLALTHWTKSSPKQYDCVFYVDTYDEPKAVKASSPREAFSKRQSKATFAITLACWVHHADDCKLKRELVQRANEGFIVSRIKCDQQYSLEHIDYEWCVDFYKHLRRNEFNAATAVMAAESETEGGYDWKGK